MLFNAPLAFGAGVLSTLPEASGTLPPAAYRPAGNTTCAEDSRVSRGWMAGSHTLTGMRHKEARAPQRRRRELFEERK